MNFATQHIYIPKRTKGSTMRYDDERMESVLKALADRSRLQIVECIREGISNPGEIARALKRHRSTVEKHMRVLLAAGLVEKVPALTKSGQLTIRYEVKEEVFALLENVENVVRTLIEKEKSI